MVQRQLAFHPQWRSLTIPALLLFTLLFSVSCSVSDVSHLLSVSPSPLFPAALEKPFTFTVRCSLPNARHVDNSTECFTPDLAIRLQIDSREWLYYGPYKNRSKFPSHAQVTASNRISWFNITLSNISREDDGKLLTLAYESGDKFTSPVVFYNETVYLMRPVAPLQLRMVDRAGAQLSIQAPVKEGDWVGFQCTTDDLGMPRSSLNLKLSSFLEVESTSKPLDQQLGASLTRFWKVRWNSTQVVCQTNDDSMSVSEQIRVHYPPNKFLVQLVHNESHSRPGTELVLSPETTSQSQSGLYLYPGSQVRCSATANPPAHVKWQLDTPMTTVMTAHNFQLALQLDNSPEVMSNNVSVFRVAWNISRYFSPLRHSSNEIAFVGRCRARNEVGEKEVPLTFIIKDPGSIAKASVRTTVAIVVTLLCSAVLALALLLYCLWARQGCVQFMSSSSCCHNTANKLHLHGRHTAVPLEEKGPSTAGPRPVARFLSKPRGTPSAPEQSPSVRYSLCHPAMPPQQLQQQHQLIQELSKTIKASDGEELPFKLRQNGGSPAHPSVSPSRVANKVSASTDATASTTNGKVAQSNQVKAENGVLYPELISTSKPVHV